MSEFGTETGTMQQAARHVGDVNASIQQQLSTLRTKLDGLQGAWAGDAARTFDAVKARWDENARRLNQALADIGTAVGSAGTAYQASDDTERSTYSSIQSALG